MPKKKPKPIFVVVGAPDWMATFADMMSLLLTFFILLFSVAEEKSEKVLEVYRSFQVYFDLDPEDVKQLGYYPIEITLSKIQGFLENSLRPPSNQGNTGRTRTHRKKVEKIDRFAAMVDERNNQLVEVPGAVLFARGQAEIRPQAIPTLIKVGGWLRRRPNNDIKIIGHTSSHPLPADSDADDHLHLGYLRAMAVAKFLAGEQGDLSVLASQQQDESLRHLAGKIKNISIEKITVGSLGDLNPNPIRKELWEDPEKDDRVEIMFLPESQEES